jgi:hypothetical protein
MKTNFLLLLTAFALLPWAVGCPKPANQTAEVEAEGEDHGHSHGEEDDALFWHIEDDAGPNGYLISIGQHGLHLHAGEKSEAAVMIMKDGQSVGDAKVFVAILDEAGTNELVAEQAAEYETIAGEPPHYAVAFEKVPDAKSLTLSYRVELPDGSTYKNTAAADVVKH